MGQKKPPESARGDKRIYFNGRGADVFIIRPKSWMSRKGYSFWRWGECLFGRYVLNMLDFQRVDKFLVRAVNQSSIYSINRSENKAYDIHYELLEQPRFSSEPLATLRNGMIFPLVWFYSRHKSW